MQHKVTLRNTIQGCQASQVSIAYEGKDPVAARQEYNRVHRILETLWPEEKIVGVIWWIDGEPHAWNEVIRPYCDHCGHLVDHPVKRWKETKTFLCQQHMQEMLAVQ